jgi:HEPN domain-containing protein
MADDPARAADTKGWLSKAEEDLRAARQLLEASRPLTAVVVFHCQQAAEKALKAFLVWHDVSFRKTHYLKEVGDACVERDSTLTEVIGRAMPLTEYAWKFRYPGEPGQPSKKEAKDALAIATEVFEEVAKRLPTEVRP